MLVALWPLVFMLLGAGVYVMATKAELKELGRLLFMAGSFALAFALASAKFTLA